MEPLPHLIIATRNSHKTAEIAAILDGRYQVSDVAGRDDLPQVEETGSTFLENASLKAVAISERVDGLVMADDSGLEVTALDGAPGVWSSSFGGIEGDHSRNNARLMTELEGVANRHARFVCTIVIAANGHVLNSFRGIVSGQILTHPAGSGGFGYDPLFVPTGHTTSFAELPATTKNTLSHRARAIEQAIEWLKVRE